MTHVATVINSRIRISNNHLGERVRLPSYYCLDAIIETPTRMGAEMNIIMGSINQDVSSSSLAPNFKDLGEVDSESFSFSVNCSRYF